MNRDSSSRQGRLGASGSDEGLVDRNGSTPLVDVVLALHDDTARSELRVRLEQYGGLVIAAEKTNATQALGATLFHSPRVCLLGLDLPGDVEERIKSIRAERPATRIGIIARSADQPGVLRAVLAGADGVLLTSEPPEAFAAEVHALARGERVLPPEGHGSDEPESADRPDASEIDNQEFDLASSRHPLVVGSQEPDSWLTAAVLYVPRFSRHLRRRRRSGMRLGAAWTSAHERMRDYR